MSCAKFQENRFRIDGEIDEKHALQIILSQTIALSTSFEYLFYGSNAIINVLLFQCED